MAVTKLWAVKSNLGKVIDYANNPNKTRNPKYSEQEYQALADVLTYAKDEDFTVINGRCRFMVNDRTIERKVSYDTGWNK